MGSCFSAESRRSLPGSPHVPSTGCVRRPKNLKRRSSSCISSFDYGKDEPLHRIPGRKFLNGSTEIACLFSQQGKKGLNQDAMLVWENFGSREDTIFCGVFDGHGRYGHMVAKRVRDLLPLQLSSNLESNLSREDVLKEIDLNTAEGKNSEYLSFISGSEEAWVSSKDAEKYPDTFQTLKGLFLKAFKFMDRELKIQVNIDCFCSGTTAVAMVKQGQYLVVGNVGDSRAVLGTRNKDNNIVPVQLTIDLKPNVPAEAERIKKCKGRVFALKDEPDAARVWLPNHDSPGLAMARAFGDFCLKDFGLISVPDMSYRRLSEKDEFVVLATDGIWDALSNQEVVDIVAAAPKRSLAARALVEAAVLSWRWKFPTSRVDDCTVVCLYLDSNSNNSSTASIPNKTDSESSVSEPGDIQTGKEIINPEENGKEMLLTPEAASCSESVSDWSAHEGVARVDTLLSLPRFVRTKEDKDNKGTTR